jgi:hypothetical protein
VPRARAPLPPGLSRRALIGASFVLLKPRGARADGLVEAITPPPYAEPTGELVTVMRAAIGGDADAAGSFEALGQAWDKNYHGAHTGRAQSYAVVSKAFDICQAQDTYLGGFGKISEKKVAVVTELLDKADALLEQGI